MWISSGASPAGPCCCSIPTRPACARRCGRWICFSDRDSPSRWGACRRAKTRTRSSALAARRPSPRWSGRRPRHTGKLTAPMLAQLAADDFTEPRARRLIGLGLERRTEGGEPAVNEAIINIQDDPQCGGVVRALSLSELSYDDVGTAFRDSLKALKLRRIGEEIQEVKTAQMVAERAGQAETARTLMLRQNALQQERQRLLSAGPLPLTEVGSVNA